MTIPELIAHRGYAARYPENTLVAVRAAVAAGACYVEIDVQLTADGVPVVVHDADLRRTAGRDISVLEQVYAQLADVPVGEPARFDDRFLSVKMPTLETLVTWLKTQPQVTLLVEIKEESLHAFGTDLVVGCVMDVIAPAQRQCVVISYDVPALEAARRGGCEKIGWVLHTWDEAAHRTAQVLQPDLQICNYTKVPDAPDALWPGPWQWALYEITEPSLALVWAEKGAAFVETMAVGEMLADPRLRKPDVD